MVSAAGEGGEAQVGAKVAGMKVLKRVLVALGEAQAEGDWTQVSMRWQATFPERLFPMMEGAVELAPVEKEMTRLTVSGTYEPPLGRVGKWLDEAAMHKVAESTVQELAEAIAIRLEAG